MALQGDVVLRLRICRNRQCQTQFFICSRCDRGQRYCSLLCRHQARRQQRRCANRRHQQSAEGRADHRDRQRRYRERKRTPVTDQSSISIATPASFECGRAQTTVAPRSQAARLPRWPQKQASLWPRCRICGRMSRFVDPFPRIPIRR